MDPIWLKNYPPHIAPTIDSDVFTSVNAMLDWVFEQYKNLPAFGNMDIVISFAEIDKQSKNFAAFLTNKLGVVKGDRLAIMMPNILQYPVIMFGALRAGCVVINMNFLFTPEEFEHQLCDSQATTLVILDNFAHSASSVIQNTKVKNIIVTKVGDVLPAHKASLVNFYIKYIKRKVPKWHFNNYYKYKDVLAIGAQLPYTEVSIKNSDIAFIQYTGGTSGLPKGAMLTHRNILANIFQITEWCKPHIQQRSEIVVTILPIFHIAGIIGVLLFMYHGGMSLLITNPMYTKSLIKDIKKYKFTIIYGVNGLYRTILNDPNINTVDFSSLKMCIVSGAELQRSVAMRWQNVTKQLLIEGYGMTETSLAVTCCPIDTQKYTWNVGFPLPSTEISIRNDNGDELGIDYPGEIWVRGPQVMLGYWNKEEENKKVITNDGWFKTGDVGSIDDRGVLRLIDRKKDIILVFGFQVYPSEVEKVIGNMPEVKEVAVVDVFDEIEGEIVKAFIVPNDPNLTTQQVINYCEQNLLYYKVPKAIEFRTSLPKSTVGKILRRALRSEG